MTRFLRSIGLALAVIPAALWAQSPSGVVVATTERAGAIAPAAVADSAIGELETFLTTYKDSPLRANALFQLGELLVRRADEQFAAQQRLASSDTSKAAPKPDYAEAISRYEELVHRYPSFPKLDAAAYTLGTLYALDQRYADAVPMFTLVAKNDSSRFQGEAYFRLGDALFEEASKQRGDARRALFAQAASAYEAATTRTPKDGDIYMLSLYKLGWSYYNQATQSNTEDYQKAVHVFGQLVDAYDKLTPQQQARLGLRGESIEYMAVAFTQVGGADAANQYFADHGGSDYKLPVLRRVAQSLRDQGDFSRAVEAYQTVLKQAPTDSSALGAQEEIVDIYQNRMLDPEKAQAARLALADQFAPGTAWAQANPALADSAKVARERALREGAQYVLAHAQQANDKAQYANAAQLYDRYLNEFGTSDSAQVVATYQAEALFGEGEYARAGAAYSHAAYGIAGAKSDSSQAITLAAGRNAIVAYDSALAHNKNDQATQDSMFAAVDRFVQANPSSDVARKALIEKGRRASEAKRWDVMASTFRDYATRYPNDPYTPTAQKLVGDAMYKNGQYAEAQTQWESAQAYARQHGNASLADSIASTRTVAANLFADTLIAHGDYKRAAEEVYVAYADKNPGGDRSADALRDAIETYMLADSMARQKGGHDDDARARAAELSARLVTQYPNYKYRVQYQNLNASLLADLGKRDEAIQAYTTLVAQNQSWPGRSDAMIRLAVLQDSAGHARDAAQAYQNFALAYPGDKRAADAMYNAAVTYVQAGDTASAARAYGQFGARFPSDPRAADAQQTRIALLQAAGDSSAAKSALASACANPTAAMKGMCSAQIAQSRFATAMSVFQQYKPLTLKIARKSQLTKAGVAQASVQKRALLRELNDDLGNVIKTGDPDYLSAASYYAGLAQFEYGKYVDGVELPAGLTDAEHQAAVQGASAQADQYYQAARQTWQELVDKAQQEHLDNEWVNRAKDALGGHVDRDPPATVTRTGGK